MNEFEKFYTMLMEYYGEYGRHDLPWRKHQKPYHVTVSEIMLQQTQAPRVVPFFERWIAEFPNWKTLAQAPQSKVLELWKGLGYNSRALRLHKLAKTIHGDYKDKVPQDYGELLTLPGVGPYTAGAIRAFAYDIWSPTIDTNIRRVIIHHFLKEEENVSDGDVKEVLTSLEEYIESPREFYEAMMDYGSNLPKELNYNPNKQSKHYFKQSTFKGSDRELRGKILDILLDQKNISTRKLYQELGQEKDRYKKIVEDLVNEGFLDKKKNSVILR